MREDSWQTKKRFENEYSNSMMRISKLFFSEAMEGMSSVEEQLEVLRSAGQKPLFHQWAKTVAQRMITGLSAGKKKNWREAAAAGSEGQKIRTMLQTEMQGYIGMKVNELVMQNAELISSLPLDVAQQVTKIIQREVMKGKRSDEIAKMLRDTKLVKRLTMKRIALIARTETGKASTALTRAQSEDIGADWYVWRTSKDARVRAAHRDMDRVLVGWDDPPSPEQLSGIKSSLGHYHAGDAPNCRCYPQPLLSLNDVGWPVKVYYSGRVQYMNRSVFTKIFAKQEAA